jgi:hypothetical protein
MCPTLPWYSVFVSAMSKSLGRSLNDTPNLGKHKVPPLYSPSAVKHDSVSGTFRPSSCAPNMMLLFSVTVENALVPKKW